ncbi:DegT/DnrJ/EryC1/StrS family aminotransferase [Synechococcus sp. A15-28]|jgi:dTDP-4-amino-4,6-dideoxygalactose transaminase|uniref:DegT/DnrJ/EryC1/StrS family aminotransferase n=1 Tax=Synechococcus sp. A15-28 TaxID=1050638 RepID=UPI001648BE97|nr:DegT/DnrJ/EryC1/StrS family aminotransferase [Synechococcus sp. A15-28]MBA4733890.1 DegT/DnrJ/EryC1/StrS family aminotransferase [Synechococcus sp.]QNI41305.1 putative pleiotropic regulatory protein [Synechococcus sp. A15-28]
MQVPPFSLSQQISDLGQDLEEAVLNVLRSGQYIGGPQIKQFEDSFASSLGCSHAVGCNSGTDALILALRALDIGAGDEVITCSFSFFATAEAISAVGATPVFVDVDPTTYLIDLDQIEAAVTPATKALMPVHLFGRPVDMDRLMAIAEAHNLKVVEDCAQASGAHWNGKPVGSFGDVGCFSFFPTKNLGAAGDGGAATSNDDALAQTMRELAVHGMPKRYLHTALGYNSRLDAMQAAVLNVKLPKLGEWISNRTAIATRYRDALADLKGLTLPTTDDGHSWNQFVVRIGSCPTGQPLCNARCSPSATSSSHGLPESCCRDWLKQTLMERGVNTIIYYPIPIHRQPAYAGLGLEQGSLPVTEQLCSQVLSLPIFPELSQEQQQTVIDTVKQVLDQSSPTPLPLAGNQERMVA